MIEAFEKEDSSANETLGKQGNNWSGVTREYDFSEEESVFVAFMKEFRYQCNVMLRSVMLLL